MEILICVHKGIKCSLYFSKYHGNNRTAIKLSDVSDGLPWAVATVNVPDCELESGEVCIKNYSENEGMVQSLMKADIIHAPHRYASSGYVKIPICKLTEQSLKQIQS